jgi:hypothetical protein
MTLGAATLLLSLGLCVAHDVYAQQAAGEAVLESVTLYFGVELEGPENRPVDVAEKRLRSTLERMGLMIRDSSPYQLRGRAEIVDEQTVTGGLTGSQIVIAMELPLFLKDTSDGQTLGSEVFSSKGMGGSRAEAVRKAVKNLKFDKDRIEGLRDRAVERVAILIEEECNRLYAEAQALNDQRLFRDALVPLSQIPKVAGIYPQAIALKREIDDRLWREEENRVKQAQARAAEAEAIREKAMYAAKEADARARALADSLKILEEKEAIEQTKLAQIKEEARIAEAERETAKAELNKSILDYDLALREMDAAIEPTRPPVPDPATTPREDASPAVFTPKIPEDNLTGKWELVKKESSLEKSNIEAQTLQLEPGGDATVWLVGKDYGIHISRGRFSLEGDRVRFTFDEDEVTRYLDREYSITVRGRSRLNLVDTAGNNLAFCKIST